MCRIIKEASSKWANLNGVRNVEAFETHDIFYHLGSQIHHQFIKCNNPFPFNAQCFSVFVL